eukprot:714594_1
MKLQVFYKSHLTSQSRLETCTTTNKRNIHITPRSQTGSKMIKFASLHLFVLLMLSSVITHGKLLGAAKQDCTPDKGDDPVEVCTRRWQWVKEKEKLECKVDYDCCLCGRLKCGPKCDGFKANGDHSAYYVPNIIIEGNSDDGADVVCDEYSSCEGAVFTGTNIKGIKCGKYKSCKDATMTMECIDPCKVECVGDAACKGATLAIDNVESVKCAERGCAMATIDITDPDDEFKLECGGGDLACRAATITIEVDANKPFKIKSIDCGATRSCQGATIVIENTGDAKVTVEEINCEAEEACRWATFEVIGNVKVKDCDCEDGGDLTDNACRGTTFTGFECDGAPPTRRPTDRPTNRPTVSPTNRPTVSPTSRPTVSPTNRPTVSPTNRPTVSPTN